MDKSLRRLLAWPVRSSRNLAEQDGPMMDSPLPRVRSSSSAGRRIRRRRSDARWRKLDRGVADAGSTQRLV